MRRESAKLAFAELQGLMLHAVFGLQELLADRQSTIKIRAIRTVLTYSFKSTDLDRLLQTLKPFLASFPPERQHNPGVSSTPVHRQPFPSDLAEVDAKPVLSRIRTALQEHGTTLEWGVDCTPSIDILLELLVRERTCSRTHVSDHSTRGATDG